VNDREGLTRLLKTIKALVLGVSVCKEVALLTTMERHPKRYHISLDHSPRHKGPAHIQNTSRQRRLIQTRPQYNSKGNARGHMRRPVELASYPYQGIESRKRRKVKST
jgi:hypothetical protein